MKRHIEIVRNDGRGPVIIEGYIGDAELQATGGSFAVVFTRVRRVRVTPVQEVSMAPAGRTAGIVRDLAPLIVAGWSALMLVLGVLIGVTRGGGVW